MEGANNLEGNLAERIRYVQELSIGESPKAQIILTLLGIQQASDLSVFSWNSPVEQVEQSLRSAGLSYCKKETPEPPNAVATYGISLEPKLAARVLDDLSEREYGMLMGYPQTAIDAFVAGELYEGPLPADIEESPVRLRFSKDHYQEEFAVVRKWNEILKQYLPS